MVIGPLLRRVRTVREGPGNASREGSQVKHVLRRVFVYLCAAAAGLTLGLGVATADPVYPPGSRVGLDPPGEMRPSTRFPGFEDVERHASITILDLPASAYTELESAAFSDAQKQLKNAKRESFPFGSGIGFLITGVIQHDGTTLHRWSLLAQAIGGDVRDLTTIVNVEVPESALAIYPDNVIRNALASVTFRPAPIQEQLGLLPFKISNLAGFQVMQVMPTGVVVMADVPADKSPPQSLIVISVGTSPVEASDRARFARDILASAPVGEMRLQSSESMRINGAAGHEIRAQGVNPAGKKVSMVQWLRFGSGGFLRIVAISPSDQWDTMFERFRAMRDGIEMR